MRSRDRVVSAETRPGTGRSGVRIPVEARDLSLLRNDHRVSGVHQASYSMGIGGFLPEGKSAEARE